MDLSEMTNIREEWKMKHSRLALMLLVIVLALGMVSAYAETEAEPEFDGEIRIGLICPVTGTSKAIGDYQQNGFNLAMEEINAAGGILGKKVDPVKTMILNLPMCLYLFIVGCIFMYI